uniref:N-acetyltransferase domain-containing protein n=1 Tax=Chromera velia CCMP2878 TaxID=1169474 RepID=A0A0G4I3Q9_9ALVE|eukprot:Cvel_10733.t1-p1 / transcript=Cvel_10733.t1 / gene=Cvel_10733 / organism=Chromera_velia_CCMP2878 / gene_product=Phosphinothricin N-acetyltransferase, putative / transcript_product=Phosphinothricin N-acetyltransferase, putative / location=Cvel_scaffold654:31348-31911(-) / protein_length=188 / sequence_SO=supercontig / SO=protein_coding / is_pseudo=false
MFECRVATEEDLPSIHSILEHFIRNSVVSWRHAEEDPLLKLSNMQEQFRARKTGDWIVAVSKGAGTIVGYAYASPFKALHGWNQTVENSIYVRKGYEGKGIGSLLLGSLICFCREWGFKQMVALIACDGTGLGQASLKLHGKHGFVKVGQLRACGSKFDHIDMDCTIMQRSLQEEGEEKKVSTEAEKS